ncbi:outer membrane beta-barrel protein [Pedobacter sp. UYP24]
MSLFTKLTLSCLLVTGSFFYGKAQTYTVKGAVLDTAGLPLPGAIVRVNWVKDSLAISTNTTGDFNLAKVKSAQFTLTAAYLGFQTFKKDYQITQGNTLIIPSIKLLPISNTLDGVTISGTPPIRITEDTVSFNAAAFPVREGDAVDEVLKKLPGIVVDKDGNVTNQGVPITKIKVNGKDFYGTDVATAIKNMPADIIKNIQLIDDYGDQAKLTGIKTGEPEKVLNLTIAEDKKKGYFARASGGVGSSDRYNTSLRGNLMKGERQISFDGTVANANFRNGNGDGVNTKNGGGINYRNEWSPKLSADANYNFDNTKNNTISSAFTRSSLQDSAHSFTRLENADNNNSSNHFNHNFSANLEYKADTMNYLKISPGLSYNNNEGNNSGASIITQESLKTNRLSTNFNTSNSLNFRTNLFFNHKFSKHGRNLSMWGNVNYSDGNNFRNSVNDYIITNIGLDSTRYQNQLNDQTNSNLGTYTGVSYMEPFGKKTFVEFNYNFGRSATSNEKKLRDVIGGEEVYNNDLSNNYDFQFVTNKVGVNYRFIDEKLNYTIGVNAQPAILRGQNVSKNVNTMQRTFNVTPSARFVYKFTKQETVELNYWARNNQPGFYQLQPISDNSNLQNIVTGNPNLKPEFVNSVNAHYKQSDWNLGHLFDASVSYNQTQNKIVTTKVLVPGTINQFTTYTNTDGFYDLNGNYGYTKPFTGKKFTINYGGWGSMQNNVSFVDRNRNNAKRLNWGQSLGLRVDLEDITNLELETSYSESKIDNSLPSSQDRKTGRLEYGINGRNYFFKVLTVGYDFSKVVNSGYNSSFINNPTILRLFMEYKFLKKDMGVLRLDGFDLFNQNSGVTTDAYDNVIVDRRVNRLGRYFMCSFIFKVRNFGG